MLTFKKGDGVKYIPEGSALIPLIENEGWKLEPATPATPATPVDPSFENDGVTYQCTAVKKSTAKAAKE